MHLTIILRALANNGLTAETQDERFDECKYTPTVSLFTIFCVLIKLAGFAVLILGFSHVLFKLAHNPLDQAI